MKCNIPEKDLGQRLNDTICRYDGKPVRIRVEGKTLHLYEISRNKLVGSVPASDPLIDISGVPLGYAQLGPETVVYFSRKPARIYKQGVTDDCLVKNWPSPQKMKYVSSTCLSRGFEDMVLGKYPSLDDALKMVRMKSKDFPEWTTEIAVSREVALKYDHDIRIIYVYYKARNVGYIIEKNPRTVIVPSYDDAWVISHHLGLFNWQVE